MRELLESLEEGRDRSNAESLDASRSALNMVKRAVAAAEAAKRMAFSPKSKKLLERALTTSTQPRTQWQPTCAVLRTA